MEGVGDLGRRGLWVLSEVVSDLLVLIDRPYGSSFPLMDGRPGGEVGDTADVRADQCRYLVEPAKSAYFFQLKGPPLTEGFALGGTRPRFAYHCQIHGRCGLNAVAPPTLES